MEAVQYSDIDLRAVESTISLVEFPADPPGASELIQGFLQARLGTIPRLDFAHVLLWAGRELELESEAKQAVEITHKVEQVGHFGLDLVLAADLVDQYILKSKLQVVIVLTYVGIILLEPSHSGQATQGTACLISVQHAKISVSKRQFLVASFL